MRKDAPTARGGRDSAGSSVGQMFGRIAPTYDLLNHLLSLGRDYSWRYRTAQQLGEGEVGKVIDLATGTGDLLLSLLAARDDITSVVGLDVSENMLDLCREKLCRRGLAERVELVCGDAAATPFPDDTFDVATMGFGIRNMPDALQTLREIHRLLKPGGVALILEFSLPKNRAWRWCYLQYLRRVVPLLGALISSDRHAYRYLNESIEGFYSAEDFAGLMRNAGFQEISVVPLTFGVASIYRGLKGPAADELQRE
jgi:demethylmenaquinone methyltransferase/2-methoxy-6-polyprenyl-1,4-benzoquinol methylase